jgi:hypothetical protein
VETEAGGVETGAGAVVRLEARGADPADLVALGAATATLRAALADFGWASVAQAEGDRRTAVQVNRPPDPERPDQGRAGSGRNPGR